MIKMLSSYLNINNIDIPYYIINDESEFYMSLIKQNKTKNLILYNEKDNNFLNILYKYLKDTKIIINSYRIILLQIVASYVSFIKYLKINHGIKYFKPLIAKIDIINPLIKKGNMICSSPFEYQLLTRKLNYSKDHIYNSSLIRYERFQFIKKREYKSKCILVSFTYRPYNKYFFEKSEYKNNLDLFLNDKELITYLYNKNIELIYIPHHQEIELGKNYSQNIYKYAKIKKQNQLENYIEQCSLFITDISSISFDFMFQNKPVLFYSIDKYEQLSLEEKNLKIQPNDTIYFGNYFTHKRLLINKIKYYINNSFKLEKTLKEKYESLFFQKTNIISKTVEIINRIIKGK